VGIVDDASVSCIIEGIVLPTGRTTVFGSIEAIGVDAQAYSVDEIRERAVETPTQTVVPAAKYRNRRTSKI
jgi:hypothetical protein